MFRYVFKSALNPLKITFTTQNIGPPYSIIYKNGDDLRQDQLCIQILLLFDKLLKAENLDLKLTPYVVPHTVPSYSKCVVVHLCLLVLLESVVERVPMSVFGVG